MLGPCHVLMWMNDERQKAHAHLMLVAATAVAVAVAVSALRCYTRYPAKRVCRHLSNAADGIRAALERLANNICKRHLLQWRIILVYPRVRVRVRVWVRVRVRKRP